MIKIVANGIGMDLPADLRIPLTIENPLFSTDRIPVAYTTNIDFPLTQNNLRVFGFQDKLFLRPSTDKIPAMLYINELRVMAGTLCFDSCEDKAIRASFVGADIEDFISKDLSSMKLDKWYFGELTDDEKRRYATLLKSAHEGNAEFVCAPVATKENPIGVLDFINHYSSGYYSIRGTGSGSPSELTFVDRYCPAIRLPYLLNNILSNNVQLKGFDLDALNDIMVIGCSKINEDYQIWQHAGGLDLVSDDPVLYEFSLAASLPQTTTGVLLRELLKMFCLSIYVENDQYIIRPNDQMMTDRSFDDWSDKISDIYSIGVEKGKLYQYGYSSFESQENISTEKTVVQSILEMFNHENEFTEESYFEIEPTGEIFLRDGYRETDDKGKVTYEDFQYKLVAQGGFGISNTDEEGSYDSRINISPPRPIIPTQAQVRGNSRRSFSIIEPPGSDGRLQKIYLGIYLGFLPSVQKTQNTWVADYDNKYPVLSPYPYDMLGVKHSECSLAWGGENGLFNLYHKQFAEWISKDQLRFRSDVNLTEIDLRDIRMFRKKLIKGKKFIIRQIDIEIDHDGIASADAEFIEMPDSV